MPSIDTDHPVFAHIDCSVIDFLDVLIDAGVKAVVPEMVRQGMPIDNIASALKAYVNYTLIAGLKATCPEQTISECSQIADAIMPGVLETLLHDDERIGQLKASCQMADIAGKISRGEMQGTIIAASSAEDAMKQITAMIESRGG